MITQEDINNSEEQHTSPKDSFRKELKELLTKYNVSISWDYDDCSDTHGMTGEGISFDTNFGVPRNQQWELLVQGASIDAGDL